MITIKAIKLVKLWFYFAKNQMTLHFFKIFKNKKHNFITESLTVKTTLIAHL